MACTITMASATTTTTTTTSTAADADAGDDKRISFMMNRSNAQRPLKYCQLRSRIQQQKMTRSSLLSVQQSSSRESLNKSMIQKHHHHSSATATTTTGNDDEESNTRRNDDDNSTTTKIASSLNKYSSINSDVSSLIYNDAISLSMYRQVSDALSSLCDSSQKESCRIASFESFRSTTGSRIIPSKENSQLSLQMWQQPSFFSSSIEPKTTFEEQQEQEQQQQQQIEVSPGYFLPLRKCDETLQAVIKCVEEYVECCDQSSRRRQSKIGISTISCPCCQYDMFYMDDAEIVLCSDCWVFLSSPSTTTTSNSNNSNSNTDDDDEHSSPPPHHRRSGGGGGVCVGIKESDIYSWLERNNNGDGM